MCCTGATARLPCMHMCQPACAAPAPQPAYSACICAFLQALHRRGLLLAVAAESGGGDAGVGGPPQYRQRYRLSSAVRQAVITVVSHMRTGQALLERARERYQLAVAATANRRVSATSWQ